MGAKSCSRSTSTRSTYSSRSSESSRFSGQGKDVEFCQEKYDDIIDVMYYYTNDYPKKKGFIFETNSYYYSIKYENNGISSKKSTEYKVCKEYIIPNNSERDYHWEKCNFSSSLTLGKIEEIVDEISNGNNQNFEDVFKEKINSYYEYKNKNVSHRISEDRYDRILSVRKIVVPYKSRAGAITGRVFASIFTAGLINISEDLRQNPEHHGLIFETNNYWYVVNYGTGGIKTNRSKEYKVCVNEIIDFAGDPYDDKRYWTYKCNFRSSLDLGDVEYYIKSLSSTYNENTYDGLRNNCQYFVKDLLYKID